MIIEPTSFKGVYEALDSARRLNLDITKWRKILTTNGWTIENFEREIETQFLNTEATRTLFK